MIKLIFGLFLLFYTNPALAGYYYARPASAASAQKFYESFNGSTEDNTWTLDSTYGSWNDDYTTTPLEGAQSLYGDSNSASQTFAYSSFTAVTGTVYARVAFRVVTEPNNTAEGISFELNDGATTVCRAYLYWHAGGFYRLYDADGSYTAIGTNEPLDDQTYWFYITYTPGTSAVYTIRDASLASVVSRTDSSVGSDNISRVFIGLKTNAIVKFDQVEVRTDTNWGTP